MRARRDGRQEWPLCCPPSPLPCTLALCGSAGSGSVDYDEFLVGLRGELSPTRRAIVDMAFKVLDKDGSGEVTLDDIRERYDTSKHPEVISGRKSRDQVLREFLDGFDGGQRDGKVTPQEFARYYANVSAYIDHDDYFELMMRYV
ncbi:hypothetical protein EON62_05550, partial [archaeon]